ncbi:hypothetical protein GA0074695_4885 [Micromonospora viridifaciens]|uniref:Uncharacterized protein n=1 Tax=Micromonospora viridifaciens TaxID=1881 RepID=A0A1C4YYX7_MICVI|nr:hypothetical protein GA0074695_4885 [Micromonospora viridifaciens]
MAGGALGMSRPGFRFPSALIDEAPGWRPAESPGLAFIARNS